MLLRASARNGSAMARRRRSNQRGVVDGLNRLFAKSLGRMMAMMTMRPAAKRLLDTS